MFFYYLFASGTCAATAAGLLYLYDKNKAETVFYNMTWTFVTVCAHLEDFYDKTFKRKKENNNKKDDGDSEFEEFVDTIAENNKISCSQKITFYDPKNKNYETCYELPDRDDLEWGFVKKKIDDKCKCRIYDDIKTRVSGDDEFVVIENKPFLQVELVQNEKKKEIHEYLPYFYLKGNKLFDKNFLRWYLNYWYQIDLEDDYSLNIIDHEINIIQIKPNQHLILEDKGNYSIKK